MIFVHFFVIILIACSSFTIANLEECKNWPFSDETNKKLHLNLKQYRNSVPPNKNNMPIDVILDLVIENVDAFDDLKQQLDISVVMTVHWIDPMLAANNAICKTQWDDFEDNCEKITYHTMPLNQASNIIWLPDLQIPNLVNSQDIGFYADSVLTQLAFKSCDGSMTFKKAQTLTLSCNADFTWYPFDKQECLLEIFNLADTKPGKSPVFNILVNNLDGRPNIRRMDLDSTRFKFTGC